MYSGYIILSLTIFLIAFKKFNCTFICTCKKKNLEIPYTLYPVPPNGNILLKYMTVHNQDSTDRVNIQNISITTRIPYALLLPHLFPPAPISSLTSHKYQSVLHFHNCAISRMSYNRTIWNLLELDFFTQYNFQNLEIHPGCCMCKFLFIAE